MLIGLPTSDVDVKQALFLLSEPRVLFAEDVHDRRLRLAAVFKQLTEKQRLEVLAALRPASEVRKSETPEFVDGGPDLLHARELLLSESRRRSRVRLENERKFRPADQFKEELFARIQGVKSEISSLEISDHLISEVCDRRPISVVKFSDEHLAVGGFGGSLGIFDHHLKPQRPSQVLSATRLHSLAFISGNFLAGTADGKLVVSRASEPSQEISIHLNNSVTEVVPLTGALVATTSADGSWCLVDVETHKIISRTRGPSASLTCAAVHPDLSVLAVGSSDGAAEFWDLRSGRLVHNVRKLHGNFSVNSIDFNSYFLASGGSDQHVKIFDLRARRNFQDIFAHSKAVSGVQWIPAGPSAPVSDLLVSASLDGTAKMFRSNGSLLRSVEVGDKIISMDLAPTVSGVQVALGCYDRLVRLWSINFSAL